MKRNWQFSGINVYKNWFIPEGQLIELYGNIHAHPYDYVTIVFLASGSDAALDALKPIIHERIDHIFWREPKIV